MNDQFGVSGSNPEMTPSWQQLEDTPAVIEVVAHERLAQADGMAGSIACGMAGGMAGGQTGGYDLLTIHGLSYLVSTSPGCYDDDYYGTGQLV